MKVEVKGNVMTLTVPLNKPVPSSSGKTLVIASTRGSMKTDVEVNGKKVIINLNAYIPAV